MNIVRWAGLSVYIAPDLHAGVANRHHTQLWPPYKTPAELCFITRAEGQPIIACIDTQTQMGTVCNTCTKCSGDLSSSLNEVRGEERHVASQSRGRQ